MGTDRRSLALVIVGVGLLTAILVPIPEPEFGIPLQSPNADHWCGTDRLGRDVVLRTAAAVRYTTVRAVLVLVISGAVGLLLAMVSILETGRWLGRSLSLLADSLRSFPVLVLALLFASVGIPVWWVLAAYFWIPVWRLVHSAALGLMEMPYVQLASLRGMSPAVVLIREVLPNTVSRVTPYSAALLSELVAVLAAIEFLGFGPPINQPSLGGMLIEAVQLGRAAPWVWVPSLVLVVALVTAGALASRLTALNPEPGEA